MPCGSRGADHGRRVLPGHLPGTGPARGAEAGSIEQFLCERYAMGTCSPRGRVVGAGDIRHSPGSSPAALDLVDDTVLGSAGVTLARPPDHVAYSDATDNVVWPMLRV